jgi:hypothetical protein
MMKAADEFDLAVLDIRDEYRRLGLKRQRHPGPSAGRQACPATHLRLTAKLTTPQTWLVK